MRLPSRQLAWGAIAGALSVCITVVALLSPKSKLDPPHPAREQADQYIDFSYQDCSKNPRLRELQRSMEVPRGGPLRLQNVYCQMNGAHVSPDAKRMAYIAGYYGDQSLITHRLGEPKGVREYPYAFLHQYSPYDQSGIPTFKWSEDSSFIWGAIRDRTKPGGFPVGPLRLVRATDGVLDTLPTFAPSYGYLDRIVWAGRGFAIGSFNFDGSDYKPPHQDRNPFRAMINAQTGTVIETLPDNVDGFPTRDLDIVAARMTEDNRVQAVLLSKARWVIWTQGKHFKSITRAASGEMVKQTKPAGGAISVDGKRYLIVWSLRAIDHCPTDQLSGEPCRIPVTPTEGVLAEYHNIESGRLEWTIRWNSYHLIPGLPPALSADGKLAMMLLPANKTQPPKIAVVSTADGKVLQTFEFDRPTKVGFTQDGKRAYVLGEGFSVFYTIRNH